MRSVKGEITVFLSLSFTLLLSFIFGILESAVIQGSKNLSRIDTDRAIYSVFGEYHQELMEQYHVLGIDLGYRTGNYEEENLIQRLHYYNSGSTDHQIKGIQYLTDQSGQAFREQVLAYMEQRYGMDLVKKFTGTTEKWEQTETEESDMEKKTDEMTDAMERVNDSLDASGSQTEGEDVEEGPSLPDEENPFRIMQKIKKEGILSVVIPKGKKVSEKSVDLSGQASKRTLKKGYGTFPTRKGLDQTTEKLLYNEYLLKTFGYAFRQDSEQSEGTDESGEKEWQSDRSDALAYELEYILQGKGSDKENLESVLFRLFLLRISGNYGCLAKDMGRVAEAEALAVTISALLLMPEAVEALKQMILVAWMEEKAIGKEQEFRRQFRDSIQTMAGALKAGYSVENAIRETNHDLIGMYDANTRIRKEYGQMVRKLELNLSVVTVLNEFAAEVKQEDVTNFITVYAAAKVSGGDSIAIIRDAARTIGEKIDTEREIQTMLAAKKLEFEIMSVIPFIMILYMKMTFGEFLSVLYGTWTGCIVMSICLVLYLGAYRFGRRILQIEI